MSQTDSYTSWISMFSISLFFASITSFACSYSDMSKTTYSWQLALFVTQCSCLNWSTWSKLIWNGFSFSASGFIFCSGLFFYPLDFGCVLIIIFFLHSSLPFILYSTTKILHSFSVFSFNSSLLLLGLLLCCFSSSSSKTSFNSKLFVYLHQVIWTPPVKCTSMSDQYTLTFLT